MNVTDYKERLFELKKMENYMEIHFPAVSENEGLARMAVAAFLAQYNPSIEELGDIKIAVSEAVTNAIIHGYDHTEEEEKTLREEIVHILCGREGDDFYLVVSDEGKGMEDVEKAMEPLYTTRPDLERSGMGFSFMEAFTDDLQVISEYGEGTQIFMRKKIHCDAPKND